MPIDTGNLTDSTYEAIMIEAERFNHDLTLQFGLLSYECTNEKDFIKKSKKLIAKLITYDDEDLYDLFYGEPPSKKEFHMALNKILINISKLK